VKGRPTDATTGPCSCRAKSFKAKPLTTLLALIPALLFPAGAEALVPPTQAFTAFAAPRTATSARLNGRINPEGAPLTYRFEYSDDDGATWSVLPDREYTGTAERQIVVGEELSGLQPGAAYSYRFSAENGAGAASPGSQVKTFVTRTRAEMAEPNRGYELVNNPNKGNQNVRTELAQGLLPVSVDGERAVWSVLGGAPEGHVGAGATYLAERTPSGWHSTSLVPIGEEQPGGGEQGGYVLDAATPKLTSFVFNTGTSALERGKTLVRIDADQTQTILQEYGQEINGELLDLTDDGGQILFVNPNTRQLESMGSGPSEVISIMPDGLPNECGLDAREGQSFMGHGGGSFQAAEELWLPGYHRSATTDAQRVYFEAEPNGFPCTGGSHFGLYERNRETDETVLIDPGAAGRAPEAIRAAPDGRELYFVTWSSLDIADANSERDIYVWKEEEEESSCLTCVVPSPELSSFQGVANRTIQISDDFSHIYFESLAQLVPGQGTAGDSNIYVLSGGAIGFVADTNANAGQGILGKARLSRDGHVLLLLTDATSPHTGLELTADQLPEACAPTRQQQNPQPCEELFLYDDRDGSLECVSCRHDGVTENSVPQFPGLLGGSPYQMSSDGTTIAFTTAEQLVPQDLNHDLDIYEWRNGVSRLISDGLSAYPDGFAEPEVTGISSTGRDIFFQLVAPSLTGFEQDHFANLYDARIGGGFPRPSIPSHCAGESCQGPIQPPPPPPESASAGYIGSGNARRRHTRRCVNRKVRRHGQCVKRRRRHARRSHGGMRK
jgi:hypothetical protein